MKICIIDGNDEEIASLSFSRFSNQWDIDRIFVKPPYRNKGYGTALLTAAIHAANKERKHLWLVVCGIGVLSDAQLEQWYGRHGFEITNPGSSIMIRPYKEGELDG